MGSKLAKKIIVWSLSVSLLISTIAFIPYSNLGAVTNSPFEQLELFNKVLNLIQSQYYREVDNKKLIQGALKGMLETLDPHSSFLAKEVFQRMQDDTSGEFGGLGIEVSEKDGILYIITPIDDTPAFKAGLKPKDKIVEINHESTIGMTLEDSVKKMRGKANSKIILGILREGKPGIQHFEIIRRVIKIPPVKHKLVSSNYGYVRLTQFQKNSAKHIAKSLKRLAKQAKKKGGIKGIILDLRSNPGGLLDEAVNVSSLFLKEGIVVSTEGRDPKNKEVRYVNKSGYKDLNTPIVVLINGASASASEIVAGALQDYQRAILMGSQSFGKGSVQTVVKIDSDNGLKLTIAQYMTPKNRKIQAVGIKPDIEIADYNSKTLEENRIENNYLREKDLRNHLVATIETKVEKVARIAEEKKERIKRRQKLAKKKKKKNKKDGDKIFEKPDPAKDYQVLQAVNLLKYQNLNSLKKN
ncbi:MAG: S41 family peptidase [Bacteriovoracaceae bacterium]|jgi:carboxyl-terminal processing protease|nr:S41 family peptidase [Bacteriovoracaceae bacterium]